MLLVSLRALEQKTFRCGTYEFEDVIAGVDSVDVRCWQWEDPNAGRRFRQRLARKWGRVYRNLDQPFIGARMLRVEADYDLFFFVPVFAHDIAAMRRIKDWRRRCRTVACYLTETWTKDLQRYRPYLEMLRDFDVVFVANPAAVDPIGRITGRPCYYLPPAVDTLRFCPRPGHPARVIDCYSMGRRVAAVHRGLLDHARQEGCFYLYDSVRGWDVQDWREHRDLLAGVIQRSRFFIAYPISGKDDIPLPRYFEAAAGGSVILGRAAASEHFRSQFDWSDAVIEIPATGEGIGEILQWLEQQPERLHQLRTNNIVQCLLRHDWLHRWKAILEVTGLEPLTAAGARLARLERMAASVSGVAGRSPEAAREPEPAGTSVTKLSETSESKSI